MKGRRKINLRAVVVIATACFLLSSALSWADVKLIVVRNTTTNALTATVCDSSKPLPCVPVAIPSGTNFTSHLLPTLGWDQTILPNGGWTIVGMSLVGTNPMSAWAGEVAYNLGSTASPAFVLASGTPDPALVATSAGPYEQVAHVAPVACQAYSYTCTQPCSQSGTCNATVTGSFPMNCSGGIAPIATTTCTYIPPQCTSYSYTLGTCQSSGTAPVTGYIGLPSGCAGGVAPATAQSCVYVAPQCTGYTYTLGTCQPSNTAPVTGSVGIPSGCNGGVTPATTQQCSYGSSTCTASNVTTWGACQSNNTQTASTYASTCTPPATPLTQGCTYTSPSTAGYTPIIFNYGSQSLSDSLGPGETKYYTFIVPAGITTLSMNISSISQNGDLDMVLTKSNSTPPTANLDRYLQDALAYYNSDIGLWGTPWFKAYPDPLWCKIGTDYSGEGIYVKSSTASPAVNQAGFAASLPGTYYVAVQNESSDAYVSYYVYVKQ